MKDVNSTLNRILELIDKDVSIVSNNFIDIQLDAATAQSLCRYASTLASIKDNKQKEEAKDIKELNKLSTEELMAIRDKLEENKLNKG